MTFTTSSRSMSCAAILALTCAILPAVSATTAAAGELKTWYVSAAAQTPGIGSRNKPFATLSTVEKASRSGDTIVVIAAPPSLKPLDGGIKLKTRQRLVGDGPLVRGLSAEMKSPRLTNTSSNRLDGDAVRLADGASVSNLRIVDTHRGAIYGRNVSGVTVAGNDVSGQNASCARGFLIPPFNAPTNVPGVGIPISEGLSNGWAGIMIDADVRRGGTLRVTDNSVHDAECGDGIDVRLSGRASYHAMVSRNDVHSLRQGDKFESVLAFGLQARDSASLVGVLDRNTQANLGNDDDPNLLVEGADSEGVFVNGVGPSTMDVTLTRNTYTNERGLGGFSANGLEMVTMGDGSDVTMKVRDSHFSGSPGDIIEEGALGTNARLDLTVERVTAERSTGFGNTVLLPFNNGDCLLAGSLGAGNTILLTVRDSKLANCSNGGLAVGSNVVNGRGPTKEIRIDVDNTRITGNRGGNLGVRNFTELDLLSVKVQRSDLRASKSLGSSIADFAAEDLGQTRRSTIDLGGGALNSIGGNCLTGGLLAANVLQYDVSARHAWWGRPGGPDLLRTSSIGGKLDTTKPLDAPPRWCR